MAIQFNLYWDYLPNVTTGDHKISNVTSPYAHLSLDGGIIYYYVVTAYDTSTSLESAVSNEKFATPFGLPSSEGYIIW